MLVIGLEGIFARVIALPLLPPDNPVASCWGDKGRGWKRGWDEGKTTVDFSILSFISCCRWQEHRRGITGGRMRVQQPNVLAGCLPSRSAQCDLMSRWPSKRKKRIRKHEMSSRQRLVSRLRGARRGGHVAWVSCPADNDSRPLEWKQSLHLSSRHTLHATPIPSCDSLPGFPLYFARVCK